MGSGFKTTEIETSVFRILLENEIWVSLEKLWSPVGTHFKGTVYRFLAKNCVYATMKTKRRIEGL